MQKDHRVIAHGDSHRLARQRDIRRVTVRDELSLAVIDR